MIWGFIVQVHGKIRDKQNVGDVLTLSFWIYQEKKC